MANDLVSGTAEMVAGSTIRMPMDFGDLRQLIDGASIVSKTVSAALAPGESGTPPTVSNVQLDYSYQVSAKFSGGTAALYNVTFTIGLDDADGSTIVRVGQLRIY